MCIRFKVFLTNTHNLYQIILFKSLLTFDYIRNNNPMTRPSNSQQQKRTYWVVDFAVSADFSVKIKEIKKRQNT